MHKKGDKILAGYLSHHNSASLERNQLVQKYSVCVISSLISFTKKIPSQLANLSYLEYMRT